MKTIAEPPDRSRTYFMRCRRVHGVLFRRSKILVLMRELWSVSRMRTLATGALCLQSMNVVVKRRDFYTSDGGGGFGRMDGALLSQVRSLIYEFPIFWTCDTIRILSHLRDSLAHVCTVRAHNHPARC